MPNNGRGDANAGNAYRVAPSSAALQNLPTQRMIDHDRWGDNNSRQDFQQRFAVGQYYWPASYADAQAKRPAPPSNSSSMALSAQWSPSSSTNPPSLASSYSASQSGPSVDTSRGGSDLNRYQALLEEDDDGVPRVPSVSRWACPFAFLNCIESLDGLEEWDAHVQSHYRGRQNFPTRIACPFDCSWSISAPSGEQAWYQRLLHLHTCHRNGGRVDTARRPDRDLIDHLWRIGVIDSPQTRQLRTNGRLAPDSARLEAAGPSRERRREREREHRDVRGAYPQMRRS